MFLRNLGLSLLQLEQDAHQKFSRGQEGTLGIETERKRAFNATNWPEPCDSLETFQCS